MVKYIYKLKDIPQIQDYLPYSVNGTIQLHPQETWAIPFFTPHIKPDDKTH